MASGGSEASASGKAARLGPGTGHPSVDVLATIAPLGPPVVARSRGPQPVEAFHQRRPRRGPSAARLSEHWPSEAVGPAAPLPCSGRIRIVCSLGLV